MEMTIGFDVTYEVSRKPHYISHVIYYRGRRAASVFVDLRQGRQGYADIWLDACWRSEYSLSREGKAKVLGIVRSAMECLSAPYRRPWSGYIVTAGVWRVPAEAASNIAADLAAVLLDPHNLKWHEAGPIAALAPARGRLAAATP